MSHVISSLAHEAQTQQRRWWLPPRSGAEHVTEFNTEWVLGTRWFLVFHQMGGGPLGLLMTRCLWHHSCAICGDLGPIRDSDKTKGAHAWHRFGVRCF